LIVIGGVLAQAFKNKLTQAEQSNEQVKSMIDTIFAQWVISLNLVLARLRLGLKNSQVDEKVGFC
jgi:ABC-type phosphate transport system auxiliary subunit